MLVHSLGSDHGAQLGSEGAWRIVVSYTSKARARAEQSYAAIPIATI